MTRRDQQLAVDSPNADTILPCEIAVERIWELQTV